MFPKHCCAGDVVVLQAKITTPTAANGAEPPVEFAI